LEYRFGGYAGRYLRVDLSTGTLRNLALPEDLPSQFLGGNGFGTKILWNEVGVDVDPLSPQNRLVFASGPFTGTIFPTAGRLEIISKSPLTGIYGDANAGGHFAPELKRSGFDMIVFEGRSPKPVYLWVHNGEAEIRDASHLWGKGTHETESILQSDNGDKRVQVASIGPAGEHLVLFSSVMSHGCAAARA